ncbi:MAG TPA: FAD-dependent monooxygenase [Clostridia bacterium]|nr:FAD-dependent monooxygenase [Clostridia bacterium]
MGATKPITIVGGGLAGLTLGIALRRRGIPVTLFEVKPYPRHRVCGEFISGRGLSILDRFGLAKPAFAAGAQLARSVVLHWAGGISPARHLPAPALSISRYELDALLARVFVAAGGDLCHHRWRGGFDREGLVCAAGRVPHTAEGGWRWFGLKVHATGVELAADLELHARSDGYVGLSRLSGGRTNVCGVFRRRAGQPQGPVEWRQVLSGPAGTRLHQVLKRAELVEGTFCSVAGLNFPRALPMPDGTMRIGDALAMIAPATGNGMSMAFESAELALSPLVQYSLGQRSWAQAQALVAQGCRDLFSSRLLWGQRLQRLLLFRLLPGSLAGALLSSTKVWQVFVQHTR